MIIEYNGKKYNKIKELLAETTIADIDKFLFNNKKITLSDFINLQEKENKEDAKGSASNSGALGSASNSGYRGSASNSGYRGSASNSGYRGSASNSGDCGSASNSGNWGVSISNTFLSSVSNKANCYSMVTEFILDHNLNIVKQNAKLIKFTKKMEGKYYTLLKGKIFEVCEFDGIKMCLENKTNRQGYTIYNGILFEGMDIYKELIKLEDLQRVVVVGKDGVYSHGNTIQEAIADFRYKISNRDASEFEYFKTAKEKISTNEIIKGYRVITGACKFGTKQFVESLGELKESYTIAEALKILKEKNAWNYETFEEFVKGENDDK